MKVFFHFYAEHCGKTFSNQKKLLSFIFIFLPYSLIYSNTPPLISHISKIKKENFKVKITQVAFNPYYKKMDSTTHYVHVNNSNIDSFSYANLSVSIFKKGNTIEFGKFCNKYSVRYNDEKSVFDTVVFRTMLSDEVLSEYFEQNVFMLFKFGPFAKEILNKDLVYRLNKKSQVYETETKIAGYKCKISLSKNNSDIGMIEVLKLKYKVIYEYENIQEMDSMFPITADNSFWINRINERKVEKKIQVNFRDSLLINYPPLHFVHPYGLFYFWTETCERERDLAILKQLVKDKKMFKKSGIELRIINHNSNVRNEVLNKQYKGKLSFEKDIMYLHQYLNVTQNNTFILINAQGEVLYRASGNNPSDYETLKKLIEQELAKSN